MSPLVPIAAALPWGAAAAWLWLHGVRSGARAALRRSPARQATKMLGRVLLTAALLIAPMVIAPPTIVGALVGFVVTRNALLFREVGHAG